MKTLLTILILLTSLSAYAQDTTKVCQALTLKGAQCKAIMVMANGYCHVHNPDVPRCAGQTSKNLPCKMKVKTIGMYCRHHLNQKQ